MNPTYEELVSIVELQQNQIKELQKKVQQLEKENKNMQKENQKLHAQLRKFLNENTPSGALPPHLKDELKQITTEKHETEKEENEKSAKTNRRNKRKKKCDRKEIHALEKCPCCNSSLKERKKKLKRIVIHLELPKVENILHESKTYYCEKCDKRIVAHAPDTLPNSKHDLDIHLLIMLLYVTGVTQRKTKEILSWFGVHMSNASVNNAIHRVQRYLGERKYRELEEQLKKSVSCGADETGWRNRGKTHYIWAVANAKTVFYRIEENRRYNNAKKLPTGKIITCDGWKAYDKTDKKLQRCWAHLLRKARNPDMFNSEEEIEQYKKFVSDLSEIFKKAKRTRGNTSEKRKEFDELLKKLLFEPRREEKNLISVMNYILAYEGDWFTFVEHKGVEPTNNRTERALRPLVIRRKVSQHSWSDAGKKGLAITHSLYGTCKLRNENFMDLIRTEVEQGIYDTRKS